MKIKREIWRSRIWRRKSQSFNAYHIHLTQEGSRYNMKITTLLHLARNLGNLAATTPRPCTSILACFFWKESQTVLLICWPKKPINEIFSAMWHSRFARRSLRRLLSSRILNNVHRQISTDVSVKPAASILREENSCLHKMEVSRSCWILSAYKSTRRCMSAEFCIQVLPRWSSFLLPKPLSPYLRIHDI